MSGPLPKKLKTLFFPATYFSARKRSVMMFYFNTKRRLGVRQLGGMPSTPQTIMFCCQQALVYKGLATLTDFCGKTHVYRKEIACVNGESNSWV